jgi:hypothetical protein
MKMKRMWINQPSALQPLHKYHGVNVLAEDTDEITVTVYFLSGDVVSMEVFDCHLADGWLKYNS